MRELFVIARSSEEVEDAIRPKLSTCLFLRDAKEHKEQYYDYKPVKYKIYKVTVEEVEEEKRKEGFQ